MPSEASMVPVVTAPNVIGTAVVIAIEMSTPVPIAAGDGMKASYCRAVESHATATAESHATTAVNTHATDTVKCPTSTMTTTLGKGILWRADECDTGDDYSKNI
jgi:hypothetical protein